MTVLDVNLLLYARNEADSRHPAAKAWLEDLIANEEWIGIPWVSLWGFLRIITNVRAYPHPVDADPQWATVRVWDRDEPGIEAWSWTGVFVATG
jgi:predicted nucleic acid-binding protein